MRAISHPCLVPLLGWRETAFDIHMVMPLYDTDLHNYINNTTVCECKAKVLAGCLIEGLSHLHGLHIMHRDLKPSNVLVQREPMAALISDFGAARPTLHKHIAGSTRCTRCNSCQPMAANGILSEARCTRYYAAPEVLLSRAPSRVFYDLSSDIWSLGMTLAQMEIGSIPFMEKSDIGMMFRILKVFGTPASASEWKEVCDPACVLGTQGDTLVPQLPTCGVSP